VFIFHKLALTDAVYEFSDAVDAFIAVNPAVELADVDSKLFNLLVVDDVNVFMDPVLTLNAVIEACCEPELMLRFNTLALTEFV